MSEKTKGTTTCHVADFYDPSANYAGSTFSQLEPRDNETITAEDLTVTTILTVDIPQLAVRCFLTDKGLKVKLTRPLSHLPKAGLEEGAEAGFDDRCDFYDQVKDSLVRAGATPSNPWMTVSTITTRKRPNLFLRARQRSLTFPRNLEPQR